jgi:hypothetical protein
MKYTYLMEPEKVQEELDRLWQRYLTIISKSDPSWEEVNEARAIIYLTAAIYCDEIAAGAIERRLHLLKTKMSLIEFYTLVDRNSDKLKELRQDDLFTTLEKFYRVVKGYKNKYLEGKYYLEEEKLIEKYNKANPDKELKMRYQGEFGLKNK